MEPPSTYLFVPGNRPDRFDKALACGAGVVVLDLEDAVAPTDKELARKAVSRWCATNGAMVERVAVRINGSDSSEYSPDLALIACAGVRQVMLPKAESAAVIVRLAEQLGPLIRILPLIESARGILAVDAIAAAPQVLRLAFGTLDYALDLGMQDEKPGNMNAFIYPASRIAIASRCATLAAPIAGITPDFNDDEALLADFSFARSFGFSAKMCIHPRQVSRVHDALRPGVDEVAWAQRVLAAAAGSSGAIQVDGKMVDRPVVARAQAILDRLGAAQGSHDLDTNLTLFSHQPPQAESSS